MLETRGRCALMTRRVAALLVAGLSLLTAAARAAGNDVGEFVGKRVVSVEVVVEGAPGYSTAELKALIDIEAGQDYSPVRIHDSLVSLYARGLISGGRVEAEQAGPDGVALRFVVKPQVRIDSVVFEGTTIFPAGELRVRLNQLDAGERLSPGAVARGLGDLSAFYSSRGYYQAQIQSETRLDPTGTRATVVYAIDPGEQALVSKYQLEVQGARVDLAQVQHRIIEGRPFRQEDIQEEMERIRQAYLQQDYVDVRLSSRISPDVANNAVAVTVNVESGPKVEVEVAGLELSDEKKREILPFYTLGGIDDFSLEEARRRLLDYAQSKGYFFAEVRAPAAPDRSLQSVRLRYDVDAGRRYRLRDIDIEGLHAIPHQLLQDEMRSKESFFLPFFGLGRGVTSNEMLRQDTNLILKRLRELGYRRAHVQVLRGVSLSGDDLIITFDVDQGPRTHVEEVGIRGNTVLPVSQLYPLLTIKATDPLVMPRVSENADQLATPYAVRGYADAEVVPELVDLGSVNGEDRVRLMYGVTEGSRVKILQVNTRGNSRTDAGRLARDFYLFKGGDWLRTDRLSETERALYDTNAFSSVTISSEPVARSVNGIEERNVNVDLTEARRYLLIYGLGWQSTRGPLSVPGMGFLNGARGLVQLTNTNMFGKLYTGSAQVRASEDELLGQLSFQNPRPFGLTWPTLVSVLVRRLADRSFLSDRYTALIQVERRLSPDTIFYLGYTFERVSVSALQGLSVEEIERNRQPIRLGRIVPSFARDTRDNVLDPISGTLTLGSFSVAASALGGNEQFVKMAAEHNRYYKLPRFRDFIYSVSGRLGLATPFGGRESLPISERFFAGGARDLRGFGFEEAGPRVLGRPVGGNAVLVVNNELRFPLWRELGGTLFSDTGNVFRRVRDVKPGDLTQTMGFGLRVKTPIGPLRFDLGFLVWNRPEGVGKSRFHFSFGQTF